MRPIKYKKARMINMRVFIQQLLYMNKNEAISMQVIIVTPTPMAPIFK